MISELMFWNETAPTLNSWLFFVSLNFILAVCFTVTDIAAKCIVNRFLYNSTRICPLNDMFWHSFSLLRNICRPDWNSFVKLGSPVQKIPRNLSNRAVWSLTQKPIHVVVHMPWNTPVEYTVCVTTDHWSSVKNLRVRYKRLRNSADWWCICVSKLRRGRKMNIWHESARDECELQLMSTCMVWRCALTL